MWLPDTVEPDTQLTCNSHAEVDHEKGVELATLTVFTDSTPGLPCNWTVDAGCCEDWETYSLELRTAGAEYGALSVWAATGRRFGACTRTVRPCGEQGCGDGTSMGWGSGFYWSEGVWFPYILDGVWRNWCRCQDCRPSHQIWLTPPVSGIVEVRFSDGTIIDPATYRVDDHQWLVRQGPNLATEPITATDGGWPRHNAYNFPVTGALAPNDLTAWEVTYLWGVAVPSVLQRAAGELACEWIKNCLGLACRLPQRVTSIARQGVTISLADVDQLLQNGLTGLTTVDSLIQRFNPSRLPSRMQIASPDLPTIRETTFQGF